MGAPLHSEDMGYTFGGLFARRSKVPWKCNQMDERLKFVVQLSQRTPLALTFISRTSSE
jgi:hypothetical protein